MATVMIVDDEPDACEPLAKFLEKSGHQVRCALNGQEALAQVIRQIPDVLLLDLLMPEMDGATFLAVVRAYKRLHSLPVVVLTALTDGPLVERVRALGVSTVLLKGRARFDDIRRALEAAASSGPMN